MTVLDDIVTSKRAQIIAEMREQPLEALKEIIAVAPPARGFAKAISTRKQVNRPALIAEIKKASPSKGLIRSDFSPADHAKSYEHGGATCLSVLTDPHFQGENAHFLQARKATTLPMLRKDFMVDPWQLYQSRALGADCILLIVAVLADAQLQDLQDTAHHLGMDVLVEVHDEEELQRALALDPRCMIGVNNRNLHDFVTSLAIGERLIPQIPANQLAVAESGINSPVDIARLQECGASAFLVGESLMRQDDVRQATLSLLA